MDELICLPIYNKTKIVGYLHPIIFGFEYIMPEIIPLITKWKKENPSISASRMINITEQMTQEWITKFVLLRKDRLLFMIQDINYRYIGYIGYSSFNFFKKQCQIDAVLRGQKNLLPGIMGMSIKTLLYFGFNKLLLENILISTDPNNLRAYNLFQKIGFKQFDRVPLKLIYINENQSRWIPDITLTENIGQYSAKMKFDKGVKYYE